MTPKRLLSNPKRATRKIGNRNVNDRIIA